MFEKDKTWLAVLVAVVVVFMGYSLGKDRALRDNRSLGPYDNRQY